MEETLIRLETLYENALRAYLEAEGTAEEPSAYRHFQEAYETLKAFEETDQEHTAPLQPHGFDESDNFLRRHFAWL